MRLLCFLWLRILVFIVVNYRSLSSPKEEEKAWQRRPFSSVSPLSNSPRCSSRGEIFPKNFRALNAWTEANIEHPTSNTERRSERGFALPFRSEEHTSELQSQSNLVCRLLLEKKKKNLV